MLKYYLQLLLISSLFCQIPNEKLYITIQMMDQVGVVNTDNNQIENLVEIEMQDSNMNCMNISDQTTCDITDGCEWMMGMCMESMDSGMMNTPHFIIMDESLGYWFVTTIASGYIAQYSLVDNQLIDAYFVGDAPAILTIDTDRKKIYCSRMMSMNGMGDMMPSGESQIIHSLTYSSTGLIQSEINEYEISSPAPHGIAINYNGTTIYASPDFAFNENDKTVIYDWKTGNPSSDDETQLLIYALYTNQKWDIEYSKMELSDVYLNIGASVYAKDVEEKIPVVEDLIKDSIEQMKGSLVDIDNNVAKESDFPMTDDLNKCKWCDFREICHPTN